MKIIFALIIGSLSTSAFGKTSVSINEKTKIKNHSSISLLDVVDTKNLSDEQKEQMKKLYLFSFWKSGMNAKLSSEELSDMIRPLMKGEGASTLQNLQFKIPSVVEISEDTLGLESAEIERAISDRVSAACGGCVIKLTGLKIPNLPKVDPSTPWEIDFKNFSHSGSFTLPLYVYFGDNPKTYYISGLIELKKETAVAVRPMMYGERLQDSDIEVKNVDVTFVKEPLPKRDELLGHVLLRPLQVGQTILRSFLKREPAIQKGQQARIVSSVNGFEVSAQMTAEENGFVGEIIKMKNPETQKILSGRVVEKGLVQIE